MGRASAFAISVPLVAHSPADFALLGPGHAQCNVGLKYNIAGTDMGTRRRDLLAVQVVVVSFAAAVRSFSRLPDRDMGVILIEQARDRALQLLDATAPPAARAVPSPGRSRSGASKVSQVQCVPTPPSEAINATRRRQAVAISMRLRRAFVRWRGRDSGGFRMLGTHNGSAMIARRPEQRSPDRGVSQ